jgi:pimeloyl-ACP methyl ester carboxylesterase
VFRPLRRLAIAVTLSAVVGIASACAGVVDATGNYAGEIDIGGRRLYLECRGTGNPTVILVSGYRNDADIWSVDLDPEKSPVLQGIARFTRVCAYDRPGTILDRDHLSRSDPLPMPRTAGAVIEELHALVTAAGLARPNVLVAHSLGGLFARLYAGTYPSEVAGLVLVDAWQEDLPELLGPEQWTAYVELSTPPPPGLETYAGLEMVDFAAASATMRATAAAHPLLSLPLAVISRTKPVALPPNVPDAFSPDAFEAAWQAGQDRLAALVPGVRRVTAENSAHYIQLSEPELVIDATRWTVEAVRRK